MRWVSTMASVARRSGLDGLVAVVTPVYNGDPYLEKTLACVQAQTYPHLIHIVLDNASTDTTPAVIARSCGGRVPILVRRNESLLPQVDNWNAAVAMTPSHARYVKMLPADDLMRPDCIERLVALADRDPLIEFVSAADVFDDWAVAPGFDVAQSVFDGPDIARKLLRLELHWLAFQHVFFRATPERLAGPFDVTLSAAFDRDFVFRLLSSGRMGFVHDTLFYTRHHDGTVTSRLMSDGAHMHDPLTMTERHGARLFPPDELAAVRLRHQRMIMRHILAWQARGMRKVAARNRQRLAEGGFTPGLLDYAAALATWPAHKCDRTRTARRHAAITPWKRITEPEFLGDRAAGSVPSHETDRGL